MTRKSLLDFVHRCKNLRGEMSPRANFWTLHQHDIPEAGGAYVLVAAHWFVYPIGKSPVFYIGQSKNLRVRLNKHLEYSCHVRDNVRKGSALYWPRYEYAGQFGSTYAYIRTHRGMTARAVEEELLASFARRYRAFPIANSAGSWNRIAKHFAP